jgi:hypothetical protein
MSGSNTDRPKNFNVDIEFNLLKDTGDDWSDNGISFSSVRNPHTSQL